MPVKLRHARLSDLDDYKRIRNSYVVLRYNCMSPLDDESSLYYLKNDIENQYCLFLDLDGKMIGAIYFNEDDLRYGIDALSVSYFLDEQYIGHGYMTQALKQALDIVFESDIELVSARVFSCNTDSQKLLLRLGFKQEGYLHQAVRGYGNVIYDDTLWVLLKSNR